MLFQKERWNFGKKLERFDVPFAKIQRFGEEYLEFDDPHGLHLEIVEREEGEKKHGNFGEITSELQLKDLEVQRFIHSA